MIYGKLVLALALSAGLFDGALAQKGGFKQGGARQGGATKAGGAAGGAAGQGAAGATGASTTAAAASTTTAAAAAASSAAASSDANASDLQLNPANVQVASQSDGQANAEKGQSPSATDPANFINFCTGKTLTNGLQVAGGSCNGIVMGDIPSSANMISTIITFPAPGQDLQPNTDFTVTLQVTNLVAGDFTNPDDTYYGAPQNLVGGKVQGHTHVTCQVLGSLDDKTPPDAATFAFFKGVNDAGDGNGGLSAPVAGGLPAGTYRCCTMTSAANHQSVLMPVAQRGAQDDCQKFTVGQGGGAAAGGAAASSAAAGTAASSTTAAAATASTTAAAAANNGTAAAGGAAAGAAAAKGGRKGKAGRGRFTRREYIA